MILIFYHKRPLYCLIYRDFFTGSMCLKNGLDVYIVSRLLGHENISITKRYLQSIEDSAIIDMAITSSPLMKL